MELPIWVRVVVRKKLTFGQLETAETSKTIEIAEIFEIVGVYTPLLS